MGGQRWGEGVGARQGGGQEGALLPGDLGACTHGRL